MPNIHCTLIRENLLSTDKEEALEECTCHIDNLFNLKRTDEIIKAFLEKEKRGSSSLINKIAIPHIYMDFPDTEASNYIGIFKSAEPVDWSSLTGDPVHLIFYLIHNKSDSTIRNIIYASIGETFRKSNIFVEEVIKNHSLFINIKEVLISNIVNILTNVNGKNYKVNKISSDNDIITLNYSRL